MTRSNKNEAAVALGALGARIGGHERGLPPAIRAERKAMRAAQARTKDGMATPSRNPAAVALGKLGAKKGGHARAAAMTKRERQAAASLAGSARWEKQRAEEKRQKREDAAAIRKAKRADLAYGTADGD